MNKTRRREAARPGVKSNVLEESSCRVWKCLKEFCIELIQCTLNKYMCTHTLPLYFEIKVRFGQAYPQSNHDRTGTTNLRNQKKRILQLTLYKLFQIYVQLTDMSLKGFKTCWLESGKGALVTGCVAGLAGLLLGPIGLALGGAVGGAMAAVYAKDKFRPLHQVITGQDGGVPQQGGDQYR